MLREAIFRPDIMMGEPSRAYPQPVSAMEEDAFRRFYLEVGPGLRSYIRKTCGNAALADDLLQEAFYRFLRMDLPGMDPPQMKAYLYKTATSLLIDHWRREKREKYWRSLWNPPTLRSEERSEDLPRALSEIRPLDRALLWLAYVEGFDHGELASALRIKEQSVRVLLFRARKKLARILGRHTRKNGGTG
jgi:RNA polymerase sigma-70 factor (ECF subfamily)